MKSKIFVFLLIACAAIGVQAQNVPNGSFENWSEDIFDREADWFTIGNVEIVSDATDGQKAVKLTNQTGDSTIFGVGLVTNINVGGPGLNGGWDYDEIPLSVEIDVKHDLRSGDSGQIVVAFKKTEQIIGIAQVYILGYSMDTFTKYSIPIQWGLSIQPDSVMIVIASGNLDANSAKGEGYMICDNIRLTTFSTENRKVKNPSFENIVADTVIRPTGWITSDAVLFTMFNANLPEPAVSASNDRKEGGNAMRLKNVSYAGGNIAPGVAITGDEFEGFEYPAFPVSKRWNFIEGWWKYSSNTDTARISVQMFKNGQRMGGFPDMFLYPQTEWSYFALPIQYSTSDVPDSAMVMISSSNYDEPIGPNAELIIDEVMFTDAAAVHSIQMNGISLGPVPAKANLEMTSEHPLTGKVVIYNSIGQQMIVQDLNGDNRLDIPVTGWQPGIYYLNVNSTNGFIAFKFIKQ